MLFLAWHGEMTTLPFLLKESCSLWGQGRRFIQDQKVTGQRYSKTNALTKKNLPHAMHALSGKFLNAQENNINLHNYLNARKK